MCTPLHGVITIRCTRSRGPRGFFCLQVFRRGPVNVAVIPLFENLSLDLNPYSSPTGHLSPDANRESGFVVVWLWLSTCVVLWFAIGHWLGKIELFGILILGLPLWFCVFASFFRFRFTRSTVFGSRSIIATSMVSLLFWIGICGYIAYLRGIPNRGADVGGAIVLSQVLLVAVLVIPLVAWMFSSPVSKQSPHNAGQSNAG